MSSRDRFAEVVRSSPVDVVAALVLLASEVTGEVREAEAQAGLDALADLARPHVATAPSAAEGLRRALGEQGGFAGSDADHDDVRSSLLPAVLERRRGLPVLLSTVWVEVARRVGVPAHSLAVPGRVLTLVDGDVVDPAAGGRRGDPAAIAHGPLDGVPLVLRVLANVRALAARSSDTPTGLWACELSLLLPRHPLDLRREHGALLVRSGRFTEGADELEEFAAIAPDPHAEGARREARMARARRN